MRHHPGTVLPKPSALSAAIALLLVAPAASALPAAAAVTAGIQVASHLAAMTASATTRQVTSCADDGSAGTLRAVIALAGSGDTIDLSGLPGIDPACTNSTITLSQGEIAIAHNLSLQGPGADKLTIAAGGSNRVLYSTSTDAPSGYLSVSALTISGGKALDGRGGCIYAKQEAILDHATVTGCDAYSSGGGKYPIAAGGGIFAGTVTLTNGSQVSRNTATGVDFTVHTFGAGVFANSQLTCTDSTLSGNVTLLRGGGAASAGSTSITRCTIDSNMAGYGAGLYQFGTSGTVAIHESTISGNQGGKGGGIYSKASLTIDNSTVAFNSGIASNGGGIHSAANIIATSSIFARNTNSNGVNPDIVLASGKTLTGSGNLVMSINNLPLPGVIATSLDPRLAPLGNHGGPTRTHALLAGSAAIDAGGNPLADASDQRGAGFAREAPAGKPDIGAYERQPGEDEIFGNGFD
ncbi:MAG TPA: choice-of-anchor Q domain-containing protein [Rudaea sp.]|nr:choice-of-anchor Q domain-containing protein [Rudaea sp.]